MKVLCVPSPTAKSPHPGRRVGRWVAALIAITAMTSHAYAPATAPTEYQVKAAFLYNFAKFVEWPAESFAKPDAEFQICVWRSNPFGDDLEEVVRGKSIRRHPIRILAARSLQDLASCHILFVGYADEARVPQLLLGLNRQSTLVVSECERYSIHDAMITFSLENDRVRFVINNKAASNAGLKISSKLLGLATKVFE